jgi:TolB-like protein
VISRNTEFTYRNKSVETTQIGRELRARYVLKGSLGHLLRGRRHRICGQENSGSTPGIRNDPRQGR